MARCQFSKYSIGVCLGPTNFEIPQPNWQYKIQSILCYQVNRAIRRHCWRLRLEIIDSSIKLFDKKKSEPTILAEFHQSFRYQRVICNKYKFFFMIENGPVHISSSVFNGSNNQFRSKEFLILFDQLAQLYKTCLFTCNCVLLCLRQYDWSKNLWRFRIRSFRIGCWIQWIRYKWSIFSHFWLWNR